MNRDTDKPERSPLPPAAGSEKCGNCGDPADAYCTVTESHERMPGWLCRKCIMVHKADIVFPNDKLNGGCH